MKENIVDLKGVFVALITPIKSDGSINEKTLRELVNFYYDKEISGLFVLGSVGESSHLSYEEGEKVLQIVSDENNGRLKLLAGVTSTCARNSIKLAKAAEKFNYDALVSTPPYFYKPSEDATIKYYQTILENTQLPLVLYNVPLFTNPLSQNIIDKLSKNERIIGMKDSSGDMVNFMHCYDIAKSNNSEFQMLIGREEIFLHGLISGAKGCIVTIAGILPECMVKIYKLYNEGNLEEALKLQRSILQFMRYGFMGAFPATLKMALQLRGFEMGETIRDLSDEELEIMKNVKDDMKLEIDKILELCE